MAWTTMRDLATGDIVLESDLDAIRTNITELTEWVDDHEVYLIITLSLNASATTYTAQSGIILNKVVPADLADGCEIYFETYITTGAGYTTSVILVIDGTELAASELSLYSAVAAGSVQRTADLSASFTGTSAVNIGVKVKSTGGNNAGSVTLPHLVIRKV